MWLSWTVERLWQLWDFWAIPPRTVARVRIIHYYFYTLITPLSPVVLPEVWNLNTRQTWQHHSSLWWETRDGKENITIFTMLGGICGRSWGPGTNYKYKHVFMYVCTYDRTNEWCNEWRSRWNNFRLRITDCISISIYPLVYLSVYLYVNSHFLVWISKILPPAV